jgi:hypothetical protein
MRVHGWRWYVGLVMTVVLIILVVYLVGLSSGGAFKP